MKYSIPGYYQITISGCRYKEYLSKENASIVDSLDKEFAEKVAVQINKDFPGVTIIDKNLCFITDKYRLYCQDYVSANCETKPD